MAVLNERQREHDRVAAASSARALKVAERTLGLMARGFGPEVAKELAAIVKEETGVGAVGVTDTERVLAWAGLGGDHHAPGGPIMSPFTRQSISGNAVTFADGVHQAYDCRISRECPLNSVIVVPLQIDGAVLGTVQLFEPRGRRFLNMNKSLGEGLGALLSSQLLIARYQEQKSLLVMSELKLAHAQVNPHFLFNALNSAIAILRRDSERARDLLIHLSHFFRKNLKRERRAVDPEGGAGARGLLPRDREGAVPAPARRRDGRGPVAARDEAPTFTLQPLIENAIKHGLSAAVGTGTARIRAHRREGAAVIEIEDDAGPIPSVAAATDSG
jgi:two-component system LytT family sensor kinase